MLGIIGFLVGSILTGLFAFTAYYAYRTVDPVRLRLFVFAFISLSFAQFLWALVIIGGSHAGSIQGLLLASDVLLITATASLALVLLGRFSTALAVLLTLIGALAISDRVYNYPPAGYVHDGLLYFNLTGSVRTVFLLAFVLIWLPAVIKIAREVGRDIAFSRVSNLLPSCFAMLAATTALFLSARRPSIIISLFAIIVLVFGILSAINIVTIRLHALLLAESKKGKK